MQQTNPRTNDQFNELIAKHKSLIENLCIRRASGDYHRCAELKQECYISIWKHANSLRPNASPTQESLWVYWQCRSVFSRLRYLRRAFQFIPLEDDMADTIAEPDNSHLHDLIESMADTLTPHERKAFLLMADGYNPDDMAHALGIKTHSATQLRYRILIKLRHNFNPQSSNNKQQTISQ